MIAVCQKEREEIMIDRNLQPAIDLIRRFEGIEDGDPATVNLDPYLCPADCWTIGWGHVVLNPDGQQLRGERTKDQALAVYPNGITMIEAEILLADDVRRFAAGVEQAVAVPLADHQFCALVAFAYNVGIGAFRRSSLLLMLNRCRYDQVPFQLARWTRAGGQIMSGLQRRRAAEIRLWGGAP